MQEGAMMLDRFDCAWQRCGGDREVDASHAVAVIVGSKDAALPTRWSRATGLPTLRVPVGDGSAPNLTLLRDEHTGLLRSGPKDGVFATMAIGVAGAKNAALFVLAILAAKDDDIRAKLVEYRRAQADVVLAEPPPILGI